MRAYSRQTPTTAISPIKISMAMPDDNGKICEFDNAKESRRKNMLFRGEPLRCFPSPRYVFRRCRRVKNSPAHRFIFDIPDARHVCSRLTPTSRSPLDYLLFYIESPCFALTPSYRHARHRQPDYSRAAERCCLLTAARCHGANR